jgi:RPA family protein
MEQQQRNTAYKVWIADLISGKFNKGAGEFESSYVETKGNKVSRVNLIGGIIDRFDNEKSISLSLDDGSGVIRLRTWNENTAMFTNIAVGDLVLIVGKVREYNNYIYVVPELLRVLDNPLWFKVRKLELTKTYGEVARIEMAPQTQTVSVTEEESYAIVEEKVGGTSGDISALRENVVSLIEKMDLGNGADVDEVVKISGFTEAKKVIDDLLVQGEIFEIQKGRIRLLG